MKRMRLLSAVCAALLLLSSCGGSAENMTSGLARPESTPAAEAPMEMLDASFIDTAEPEAPAKAPGGSVYQRPDAKLIRRCRMEVQTTQFDAAVEGLYGLVEDLGGYFENSSVYGGGYYNANASRSGEYVIRIPADKYDAFRSGAGEIGYVTYSNESTEDIGAQYYDTQARLKTLRTKQERLQMLLEKAETMEDIITLESALGDVEYEIEMHSSTLNRYDGLVNFATFTVNLHEVIRVEEQTGQADTLSERMGKAFRSGLDDVKEGTEDFLVWASYHLISLITFGAAAVAVVVILRKKAPRIPRLKRKKAKGEEDAP